ncbi:beta-hydroxyacyl-ACP dehydratase [Thorsellia kenyensis]|uniref:Beta-hydroxyacyl-ACP dehydratase n=1 Tax=Thorsellia kenyensis TaxID=1549888 RepID=A0ABV6CFE8_9GAMM
MANYTRSLVPPTLFLKLGSWRPPIAMVDRIVDFMPGEKGYVTTIKHVTFNEPYIPGHYPDNPLMPGVMIAEIFGQSSEYLSLLQDFCREWEAKTGNALKKFDDVSKALMSDEGTELVIKIRHSIVGVLASQDVKFKHMALPGDTIEATCRLAFADVNGFHHYEVEARVGRNIVSQGRIVNFRMNRQIAPSKGMFLSEK